MTRLPYAKIWIEWMAHGPAKPKQSGRTLKQLGEEHGITRERIRQLIARYERDHRLVRITVYKHLRRAGVPPQRPKARR
jgi:hypothetical protein